MNYFSTVVLSACVLLLQGCATQISPERISSSDYGNPPSESYEQIIRDRFSKVLIDPTSPIYEIDKPRKGYTKRSPMFNTQEQFGWMVCGTINSKNRYGGYTGRSPFFVLFRGDTIVEFMSGEATNEPYALKNKNIELACNR